MIYFFIVLSVLKNMEKHLCLSSVLLNENTGIYFYKINVILLQSYIYMIKQYEVMQF